MDYFLNEYSIRGQYKDVDDFFETLRNYTFPVLEKIEQQEENIIWRKDTFWQSEICNGITLMNIPQKKNERSAEYTVLQIKLIKLIKEEPFWDSNGMDNLEIKKYQFDEEYREYFEQPNCFSKALKSEGRIISFVHPNYSIYQLPIVVKYGGEDRICSLDNIYEISWWKNEPEERTWHISQKYVIQVRAKEFDFHPPHFHVISNEYEAVFKLSNGELYTYGKKRWTTQMISEIKEWYEKNKEKLQAVWDQLHGN